MIRDLADPLYAGVWSFAVCDVPPDSLKSKNSQSLPCCCGPSCSETANFVKAAKLGQFDGRDDVCKAAFPSVAYPDSALLVRPPLAQILAVCALGFAFNLLWG